RMSLIGASALDLDSNPAECESANAWQAHGLTQAILSMEGGIMFRIPLMKPFVNQAVKDRVCAVLDSGHLTEGPMTRALEKAFQDYIGCKHAIAVTSCTTGLEMALRCLDVKAGDEVIVPDFTYPATADAVAIVGATAVLVDVDPRTFLIDYDAIEAAITSQTQANIPASAV